MLKGATDNLRIKIVHNLKLESSKSTYMITCIQAQQEKFQMSKFGIKRTPSTLYGMISSIHTLTRSVKVVTKWFINKHFFPIVWPIFSFCVGPPCDRLRAGHVM